MPAPREPLEGAAAIPSHRRGRRRPAAAAEGHRASDAVEAVNCPTRADRRCVTASRGPGRRSTLPGSRDTWRDGRSRGAAASTIGGERRDALHGIPRGCDRPVYDDGPPRHRRVPRRRDRSREPVTARATRWFDAGHPVKARDHQIHRQTPQCLTAACSPDGKLGIEALFATSQGDRLRSRAGRR